MTYLVNDIFLTVQGEGVWTGRAAVFCRFSNCNLWTGREEDRATAICKFCDTDFLNRTSYSRDDLVEQICRTAGPHWGLNKPMVVLTGGEPALQFDDDLLLDLHGCGFYVAIETNGTLSLPAGIDWVCVSPKTPRLKIPHGNELKLVYPQTGRMQPETYQDLEFDHFWLSPMDGPDLRENTKLAVDYCLKHPQWRLNIQSHKVIGVK